MKEEILDTPIQEEDLPPRNPSNLLFLGISLIFTTLLFFLFLAFLDKLIITFCNNHVGEFIVGNTSIGNGENNFNIPNNNSLFSSAITHGLSLGAILGIFLSFVFGLITKTRGEFELAWKYVKVIFIFIFFGWLLLGLTLQILTDINIQEPIPYPWLIGSFVGKYLGCFIGTFYFVVKIFLVWQKRKKNFRKI